MSRSALTYRLFGIGGAGGKVVNSIALATGGKLPAVVFDTDYAAVSRLGSCQQVRMGEIRFSGGGAGGDVYAARQSAQEEKEAFVQSLEGVQIALVVVGFGGGTGAGMLPVFLETAFEHNIRTLVFEIFPFQMEGAERLRAANKAAQSLEGFGDLHIHLANDQLAQATAETTLEGAFETAAQNAAAAITLFWRLCEQPGFLKLDPTRIRHFTISGRGAVDFARARSSAAGDARYQEIEEMLLYGHTLSLKDKLETAKAALIGVLGGSDLRLCEIGNVSRLLTQKLSPGIPVELSTVLDETLEGTLEVIVFLFRSWTAPREAEAAGTLLPENASAAAVTTAGHLGEPNPAAALRRAGVPSSSARRGSPGRFSQVEATFIDGVDMDQPTYLRRQLVIDFS